jgi:gp16 family phage-associated protein
MGLRTPMEVKADFARNGISVAAWAKANRFSRSTVYAVLAGRCKAKYGAAHAIAVALGMKRGAITAPKSYRPAVAGMAGSSV